MAYVVKKPLNIAGCRREIGEILGDDEVQSASVIRSGLVAYIPDDGSVVAPETQEGEIHINAPIVTKSGTEVISVSTEAIFSALLLMQLPQAEALSEIGNMEDADILQIVGACAGSAKVKTAAKEKAAVIREEKSSKDGTG